MNQGLSYTVPIHLPDAMRHPDKLELEFVTASLLVLAPLGYVIMRIVFGMI